MSGGNASNEVLAGRPHRVDVAGRASHGVGDQAPALIEYGDRHVARFADYRTERRSAKRARLLVSDTDQMIPENAKKNVVQDRAPHE